MLNAAIAATGSYVPDQTIHNEALDQFSNTARLLISQKTGVFCRQHAHSNQCTSDLALEAARRCLAQADIAESRVEAIMVSTSSPDRMLPATAARLQYLLGAFNAFAFDINSVCSGSTFGIAMAHSLIRSGMCTNVLFVAAEVYSRILNPSDFATFPYFGDGAGAIFFESQDGSRAGVLESVLGTDGSGCDTICVPGGGTMLPFDRMEDSKSAYFQMKGREVYNFAIEKGTEVIVGLLDKARVDADQIKCFICHQANVNIVLKIAEQLGINEQKFFMNLFRYGNTASASVLIALDEAIARAVIRPGDLVVTAAFGGGLSWGANLIQL